MYNKAMKKLFRKIPKMKLKPLSQDKKHQKLLTQSGVEWYMEILQRGYHHLGNRI